ncbi:hypothetical protein FKV24_014660 [Lysobacter maris]|uniref:Uncharacterized protein n=1 Tax=Marilutibacter maris TaxID=1605891 RepID=A0A508A621_9GAMM|nr:hypothetical protein [Lysobacter maris]KAB8172524.1 hypothetical protein FKV24_014660 [Lysobacter maris]
MDLLHSATLLLAIASAAIGLAIAIACLLRRERGNRSGRPAHAPGRRPSRLGLLRAGTIANVLALPLLCVSLLLHRFSGHGPDSLAPMDTPGFLAGHPAFAVAAVLMISAAIALAAAKRTD